MNSSSVRKVCIWDVSNIPTVGPVMCQRKEEVSFFLFCLFYSLEVSIGYRRRTISLPQVHCLQTTWYSRSSCTIETNLKGNSRISQANMFIPFIIYLIELKGTFNANLAEHQKKRGGGTVNFSNLGGKKNITYSCREKSWTVYQSLWTKCRYQQTEKIHLTFRLALYWRLKNTPHQKRPSN